MSQIWNIIGYEIESSCIKDNQDYGRSLTHSVFIISDGIMP
ncbi:hypothetical protein [Methylicorpusculum sp.]|nr:hypothetical protein [Methylicorpusculum sp.]